MKSAIVKSFHTASGAVESKPMPVPCAGCGPFDTVAFMVTAIVLAAGRSTRMGGDTNKQFIEVHGRPLLFYSLDAFERCRAIDAIVLVRHPDNAVQVNNLVARYGFKKVGACTEGGIERQHSVWNGLTVCDPATDIVAVHDGARPLVTPDLVAATVDSARRYGTGIAAAKVVDTIKEANEDKTVIRTVDRTRLWAVQTPQTVQCQLLKEAYGRVLADGVVVTDEAAAVERLGRAVHLVNTPFLNLKVTTPGDLAVVSALLDT
jgi:2-C-methyl-D-erythritol 4-phosphate cytidylyltransferase